MIAASAAPYGFTISIWGTGAVGALSAFCVLALVAGAPEEVTGDDSADRVLAGTLHWIATGAAISAASLLAGIDSWLA